MSVPTASVPKGVLLGMGNPLLDISNSVEADYLAKYNLKDNDAILADAQHSSIFTELAARDDTQYVPGGATQNTIRVAQWILRQPNAASMFGCISRDDFGKRIEDCMRQVGVNPAYQYNAGTEPTGRCAVLIRNEHRSLVTELGSANCFTIQHLDDKQNWDIVQAAKYYYIAGYFLTVCPPALMRLAEHSLSAGKTLIMNLSAPFLCQFFKEPMLAAMPYVDILFGNETEAEIFAKEQNFTDPQDLRGVAKQLAQLPRKRSDQPRIVLITQGSGPVIVATGSDSIVEYPVTKLSPEQLVDTNGAGDAFAGGFIAQLVLGKPIADCVACGVRAAHCIIGRSGCTFPEDPMAAIGY